MAKDKKAPTTSKGKDKKAPTRIAQDSTIPPKEDTKGEQKEVEKESEPLADGVNDDADNARLERKEPANVVADEDEERDYLQKYQYGRELPLGHPHTNPKPPSKAFIMKESLLCQKKVSVMIPVESGSDPTVPFDVCLNGYRLSLPRNQYIDLPVQIAELIMKSHNQTNAALAQMQIGREKDVQDALS